MQKDILMVTAIAGAENCAAVLSKQFGIAVETAANRRAALAALRRREFSIMVIDESLIESSQGGSESLLKHAGMAVPLEINFAISGCGRLVREVRAALSRREREQELARVAAATWLESELRERVAGLLLHAQLALTEPGIPPQVSERLRLILQSAWSLRQRLEKGTLNNTAAVKAPKPLIAQQKTQPAAAFSA
ncbi:MAG: hypothetical protein JOZ83_13175 [Silvibacterium sp.]|nr:hypothetical protein [Silvibacterium sp.]